MSQRRDDDLEREIATHLELEAEEQSLQGLSPDDARAAARRAFGNVARVQEDARAVWRHVWLEQLANDVRFGLRMLRRSPGFATVAVLTLALGIGANTAIFSVLDAVLFQPLPYDDADRLMWVSAPPPNLPGGTLDADAVAWKSRSRLFDSFVLMAADDTTVRVGPQSTVMRWIAISAPLRPLFGLVPAAGRDFRDSDFTFRSGDVALVSRRLARRLYEHEEDAVGRPLALGSYAAPLTIVGVLPASFQLPLPGLFGVQAEPDVIVNYILPPPSINAGAPVQVIGKLRRGVTITAARQELQQISAAGRGTRDARIPVVTVTPLRTRIVGDVRVPLLLLWAAAGLIAMVACANVSNLFLTRGLVRVHEMSIRGALGASRGRIVRVVLLEGVIAAVVGGGIGIAGVWMVIPALIRTIPFLVPRLADVGVDLEVLTISSIGCLVAGVISAMFPAFVAARIPPVRLLNESAGGTPTPTRHLVQRTLAIIELASAVALVLAVALAVKSLSASRVAGESFDPDRVLVAGIRAPREGRAEYFDVLLQRVRAIPGVRAAAIWNPGSDTDAGAAARRSSLSVTVGASPRDEHSYADVTSATDDLPAVIGLRILAGRWTSMRGGASDPPVAVVNSAFVRQRGLATSADALGRVLSIYGLESVVTPTIIGVTSDFVVRPDLPSVPAVYLPARQLPFRSNVEQLMVQVDGDIASTAGSVQKIVDQSPGVALIDPRPLGELVSHAAAPRRFETGLLVTFGALALLLAMIGIYGVLSFGFRQRRRDFAIRFALGATARELRLMSLRSATIVAAIGLIAGVALFLTGAQAVRSRVYGIEPVDIAMPLVVCAAVLLTTMVAGWIAAREATGVDASRALRAE